jgi:hypothetical protein
MNPTKGASRQIRSQREATYPPARTDVRPVPTSSMSASWTTCHPVAKNPSVFSLDNFSPHNG